MIPTNDPDVLIEAQEHGYVRYRRTDGRRWEVFGACDRRGDCLIGAAIDGFGEIRTHRDIAVACRILGVTRLISDLDVPVTPEFRSCCPFTYRELEHADAV